MLFDPEELADMRADLNTMLVDSCQVLRNAQTRDSGGGVVDAYAPHGTPIPCRTWNGQSPADLEEVVQGAGMASVTTWRVLLPFGADVRGTDRLRVTPTGGAATLFEVAGTDAGASDALGVLCLCRQIEGDA